MLTSKSINAVTAILLALCILISVFLICLSGTYASSVLSASTQPDYVTKIFGNDLIEINIETDDSTWDTMIQNAKSEEYITCDLSINGAKFDSVGLRPKGNSSLSMVNSNTERYSFKINFGKYVNGQNCYGLDTMVLNNMISDATYMKEYISYDIMRFIGVDSPLFTYAALSVNGEFKGVYLAIEKYEESFMQRAYATNNGQFYNVKSMDVGGGKGMNAFRDVEADNQKANTTQSTQNSTATTTPPTSENNNRSFTERPNIGGFGGSFGGMSKGGGSFEYTDDNSDSYSSIFGNAVFDNANETDYQRVIKAMKALSEGTNIEQYFDVDQIIRYFAAHTFVVNLDSYVSSMQQNYYVYEQDGKVTILPWDYNLSFGGFQSGSASSVVNFPVDTPVSGVSLEDRPLLNMIFTNEEYTAKYHQYLQEIVDGYFNSGVFTSTVDMLNKLISPYIQKEEKAFYTYEEYAASIPVLKQVCLLRAQSVSGQLNGTIPSTTEGQNNDSSKLIDASSISLSTLGSQGGGREGDMEGGMMPPGMGNFDFGNRRGNTKNDNTSSVQKQSLTNDSTLNVTLLGAMQPPQMPNGGQMPPDGQMPEGGRRPEDGQRPEGEMPDFGQMPDTENMPNFDDFQNFDPNNTPTQAGSVSSNIWWTLGSLIVLAAAAVFVKLYPRRY